MGKLCFNSPLPSHSAILGHRTGPGMFDFCTNFSSTCTYRMRRHTWGMQGCYERIALGGKMDTKRTKTTGNRELSQAVLAKTRKRLEKCPLSMTRAPGHRGLRRRASSLFLLRSSSVLMYLRYPRRGVNCTSQTSGYSYDEAQAFLAQYIPSKRRQLV